MLGSRPGGKRCRSVSRDSSVSLLDRGHRTTACPFVAHELGKLGVASFIGSKRAHSLTVKKRAQTEVRRACTGQHECSWNKASAIVPKLKYTARRKHRIAFGQKTRH
jgi:hypothetical protein